MNAIAIDFSGIILMLALGLRHGLDPDHIALIDGLTLRFNETKPSLAKWVGTLFATGHGLVVTVIAVLVSLFSQQFKLPEWFFNIAEWVPVFLLLLVGTLNLKALIMPGNYSVFGWKLSLLPKSLKNSVNPFSVILIGILFATVFDTATQAAAWGYAASAKGGTLGALIMGLIFSAGMIATDTVDGRILHSILNRTKDQAAILNYRKWIGWAIVIISFTVAGYKIISTFFPSIQLSNTTNSLIGLGFMLFIVAIYSVTIIKNFKLQRN
ncbi:MAG: nickel permease [Bacteroidetes bacterium]|nr:nickel permease [Bacteroidota bacterium]